MPAQVRPSRAFPALIVLSAGAAVAQPPSFTGLGDVAPGTTSSVARAISADGLVVTGQCTPANTQKVFRWTALLGMVSLGGPNLASGIGASADGSVLIGNNATLSGDSQSFRYTLALGFESFLGLGSGSPGPQVFAISGSGAVAAGESNTPFAPTAVRWTGPGVAIALSNEPGFTASSARGISADGTIVVGRGSSPALGSVGFRWTLAGGSVVLPDLADGADLAGANAISGDGSTVVGYGTSVFGQEACIWVGGVATGLGDFAGGTYESGALAVSANGGIVVGYANTGVGEEAFIWDSVHGMRNLRQELTSLGLISGWVLTRATGISADGGTIVGYGVNPDGLNEAWIARFPGTATCYANCDGSTSPPILNVQDFLCFLNLYAIGDTGANCDGSTYAPVLNANDFQCFLNKFAMGCG